MYKKLDSNINFAENEAKILKFWKENNVFEKLYNQNKDSKKIFNFYEGPPTANGMPHPGHVFTRALKDCYTRFKSMKGYFVPRIGGWDTHGLPVEIQVEKDLGIKGKADIEQYGVQAFIDKCKLSVWKYVDLWKEFSNRLAYAVDMENNCYVTYHDNYIESVWWSLKEFDKKGLLFKGHKILPSCPSCGTALSSHEVAQGYADRVDLTVVAKFKQVDSDCFFLAWTTTPWTLLSNVALCVNKNVEYAKVEHKGEKFILAKELIEKHFKEYKLIETFKGDKLFGLQYEPLFDYAKKEKNAFKIICDDYVTVEDGTGIVHIAPAFGEDDARVGRLNKLPFVQMVDVCGNFKPEAEGYSGKNIFNENENIVFDLIKQNKVFSKHKHTHSYPHCWRCKGPLMYYARDSWFIKTTAFRDKMVKNNQKVNWIPDNIKNGRMGNFLENNIDWCLSRDRFWGTPLPVWTCSCGHHHTIGSKEELLKLANITAIKELHKPYVDEVTFKCSKCGGVMKRESEVIDCWYDSGAMPFAQQHYPFKNKEVFKNQFPADFISEGNDQTRGWFYSLQAISSGLFNETPYKNCIANGMVVDEFGKKMSKSLGNYQDPMIALKRFGADTVRFNFYWQAQPYSNMPFQDNALIEIQRKFLNTLYNTYAFFVLYAEIDKFNPSENSLQDCELSVLDKWILSKLNLLVKNVDDLLENYGATEASRLIVKFCDELSNWYIRRSRKRFWTGDFNNDKKAAFCTLWKTLSVMSKICAPLTPFISEEIYQNIEKPFFKNAKASVHFEAFPKPNKSFIDKNLNEQMDKVYALCELGRSARAKENLKIRQPLATAYIMDSESKKLLNDEFLEIIKEELNVKQVKQEQKLNDFISYNLKPQLKTLGPKYGKNVGDIRNHLQNLSNATEVAELLQAGKPFEFTVNNTKINLLQEDVLIETKQKEGFASEINKNLAIVIDEKLTEELVNEGIVRELISKIQALRKTSGLNVVDRIEINFKSSTKIEKIILSQTEKIMAEVLAVKISTGNVGDFNDSFEIYTNENVIIYISKSKQKG